MRSWAYLLLLIGVAASSSFGLFGGIGGGIVLYLFLFVTLCLIYSWWASLRILLMTLTIIVVALAFLLPCCSFAPEAARRMYCCQNLKQIDAALRLYECNFHCYPPAYIPDKAGKPMHSWRVLILPYLGYPDLYKQYRFDEPWDGPNNRKLLSLRPKEYVCISDEKALKEDLARTNYVAVVGKNAAWPGEKCLSKKDAEFWKGLGSTVMLTETTADIAWTEPKDIFLDLLQMPDASPDSPKPTSKHGCHWSNWFYDYEADLPTSLCISAGDGRQTALSGDDLVTKESLKMLEIRGLDEERCGTYCQKRHVQATFRTWRATLTAIWSIAIVLLLLQAYLMGAARRNRTCENLKNEETTV